MTSLKEAAKIAGTVAGLKEAQIEGLEELFRIVWREGAKAQQREDAEWCERLAKQWDEYRRTHDMPPPGPDGDYVQGRINSAAELESLVRHNLADPDDPTPPPAPPAPPARDEPAPAPAPSKDTPRKRSRSSRRTGGKR